MAKQYFRTIQTELIAPQIAMCMMKHEEKLNNYLKYGTLNLTDIDVAKRIEEGQVFPETSREVHEMNTVVVNQNNQPTIFTILCCDDENEEY